jgi:hypothetical protein
MYCLIVFSFSLQYLANAENPISGWPVTLKPTMMIPNNFIYMWTWRWEKDIRYILYELDNSDIPR